MRSQNERRHGTFARVVAERALLLTDAVGGAVQLREACASLRSRLIYASPSSTTRRWAAAERVKMPEFSTSCVRGWTGS